MKIDAGAAALVTTASDAGSACPGSFDSRAVGGLGPTAGSELIVSRPVDSPGLIACRRNREGTQPPEEAVTLHLAIFHHCPSLLLGKKISVEQERDKSIPPAGVVQVVNGSLPRG